MFLIHMGIDRTSIRTAYTEISYNYMLGTDNYHHHHIEILYTVFDEYTLK